MPVKLQLNPQLATGHNTSLSARDNSVLSIQIRCAEISRSGITTSLNLQLRGSQQVSANHVDRTIKRKRYNTRTPFLYFQSSERRSTFTCSGDSPNKQPNQELPDSRVAFGSPRTRIGEGVKKIWI